MGEPQVVVDPLGAYRPSFEAHLTLATRDAERLMALRLRRTIADLTGSAISTAWLTHIDGKLGYKEQGNDQPFFIEVDGTTWQSLLVTRRLVSAFLEVGSRYLELLQFVGTELRKANDEVLGLRAARL